MRNPPSRARRGEMIWWIMPPANPPYEFEPGWGEPRHPPLTFVRQAIGWLASPRRRAELRQAFVQSLPASHSLASQALRERRKRIGELAHGFRRRQRHFEVLRAGGWIALNPWMRRSVRNVGSRKSGNKLRTNLHQGLPRIGT